MELIILLLIIGIAAGFYRTYKISHSEEQKEFLAGTYPDPLPDGFLKGSAPGYTGKWKGKTFNAAASTGINNFGEETRYVFSTYKAKGLMESDKDVLKIDYGLKTNAWWVRAVLDELVQTAPGKYIGKAHLRLIPGLPFTVTFFRLEK